MSKVLKVSNGDYKIKVQDGGLIVLDAGNGGNVSILSNTASTNKTTGALTVLGGVGISGNVNIGNILTLQISTAAPSNPVAGMFAVADQTNWNPASKVATSPYPVFYDGLLWQALY